MPPRYLLTLLLGSYLLTRFVLSGTGKGNNYAYLVTDEPTKESVIIDPANPPEYVLVCWLVRMSLTRRLS